MIKRRVEEEGKEGSAQEGRTRREVGEVAGEGDYIRSDGYDERKSSSSSSTIHI